MENLKEVADLLYKHIRQELTAEESVQLQNWVKQSDENRKFFEKATDTKLLLENARIKNENLQKINLEQAWQDLKNLEQELAAKPKGKVISANWLKYAVAASLFLIALAGAWLWLRPGKQQPAEIVATPKEIKNDVPPDTKNAVLTLDDGTTIILDSAQNGMLATQGNMKVVKLANGKIVYEKGSPLTTHHSPLAYNTLTVPKGSDVVFLTLADGSKVWMNAASSIRYPTAFTGNERKVEITGEAYFEASPSPSEGGGKRPFIVSKGDVSVTVLGTHFNVNTYEEEGNIKVTLLEGSVKVVNNSKSVIIKPGAQAIAATSAKAHSPLTIHHSPNLEEVMAWKNGKFVFDNTGLEMIMRQIERWYDVDVSYEGDVLQQEITLTGEISRYSNASQVLELLETTRLLHFTIEGRKITVKY